MATESVLSPKKEYLVMPVDRRFSRIRRTTLREGFTFAVAAAGIVAVAASSAVSVADDNVATRIAIVADEQPAAAGPNRVEWRDARNSPIRIP
ncbi:hypothetical protein ABZW59_35675, partial [Nocardia aurea]